jgi:hypothetical protein
MPEAGKRRSMIIYDAQSMGALIGVEAGFPLIPANLAAVFCLGALLWGLKTPAESLIDRCSRLLPAFGAMAILLLVIGWWVFGLVKDRQWAQELATGRFEKLNGCVRDFTEYVNPDHDIGTDTFTLNGRPFQISDNVWQLGYHTSYHHGSPIGPNTHLLVYANGSRMLRIEVLTAGC